MSYLLKVIMGFIILGLFSNVALVLFMRIYTANERKKFTELEKMGIPGASIVFFNTRAAELGYDIMNLRCHDFAWDPNSKTAPGEGQIALQTVIKMDSKASVTFQKVVFPPFGRWFINVNFEGEKILSVTPGSLD